MSINELTELILNFSPKERKFVNQHYIRLKPLHEKRLQLFNLIEKGKVKTDEEACYALYKSREITQSYYKLKNQLVDDLIDFLFQFETDSLTKVDYANQKFRCRKLMSAGELLFTRGARNAASNRLNQAYSIAKEYHFNAEAIAINFIRSKVAGYKKDYEGYTSLTNDISGHVLQLQHDLKIDDAYHSIYFQAIFAKQKEGEYKAYLEKVFPDLEAICEDKRSPYFNYMLNLMKCHYSELIEDYESALQHALIMMDLSSNNKAIKSNTLYASSVNHVGSLLLQQYRFNEAADMAILLRENFRPEMLNYLNATELAFIGSVNAENYKTAAIYIEDAFKHPLLASNEFHNDKWLFFRANLLYLNSEGGKSKAILQQLRTLIQNKEGWNFGIKLLELYIRYDERDSSFNNILSNLMKKVREAEEPKNARLPIILNLLYALENNFTGFTSKNVSDYKLLLSGQGDYRWKPNSFEVIPFHLWLAKKAEVIKGGKKILEVKDF